MLQHTGTVQYALTVTQDNEDTNRLYQLLSQLTDIILEGYSAQLDSLRHIQGGDGPRYREVLTKYETDRHNLIKVFSELAYSFHIYFHIWHSSSLMALTLCQIRLFHSA